jgi:hypothetical protein
MGTVIYSMSVSLDGFVAGPNGEIDWAAPASPPPWSSWT